MGIRIDSTSRNKHSARLFWHLRSKGFQGLGVYRAVPRPSLVFWHLSKPTHATARRPSSPAVKHGFPDGWI